MAAVSLPVQCVTVTSPSLPLYLFLALRSPVKDGLEMLLFEKHRLAVGAHPFLFGALMEAAALDWQVRGFKRRKCKRRCHASRRAGTSRLSNTKGLLESTGRCLLEVPPACSAVCAFGLQANEFLVDIMWSGVYCSPAVVVVVAMPLRVWSWIQFHPIASLYHCFDFILAIRFCKLFHVRKKKNLVCNVHHKAKF